jgi:hypothetical protein
MRRQPSSRVSCVLNTAALFCITCRGGVERVCVCVRAGVGGVCVHERVCACAFMHVIACI